MSRDAFLRTIRERPDDDGPRLVYADWLEEHGDPRGEFIRIQCQLAKLPPWDPSRSALEEREADLLAVHDYDWLGRPPRWMTHWEFRRGFVDRFTVTRPTLGGLEGLLAESIQPKVAFAVSHQQQLGGASMRELLDSPHLEELSAMDWLEPIPNEEWESLTTLLISPRLASLSRIGLRGEAARGAILADLERRPGAENLRDLELDSFDARAALDFIRCYRLNNVEAITFCRDVAPQFAREIGDTPFRWRKIDFGPTRLTLAEVAGLYDCQRLTEVHVTWTGDNLLPVPANIKRLHLNSFVSAPFPASLADLRLLPQLEWLHVRTVGSGVDDERALREVLQRLRGPVFHLEASGSGLTLGDVARGPARERIRKLVMDNPPLSGADVNAFVDQAGFTRLQSFHLWCSDLLSGHCEVLAKMPFPPSLRRMSINSFRIDDAGLEALFRSPSLQRLTSVNIRVCHVGHRTLEALAESPGLPRLRELILPIGGELDDDDIRAFLKTPGLSPLFRVQRR
jgi:uncharacterized protein (TIGR02996 family)